MLIRLIIHGCRCPFALKHSAGFVYALCDDNGRRVRSVILTTTDIIDEDMIDD